MWLPYLTVRPLLAYHIFRSFTSGSVFHDDLYASLSASMSFQVLTVLSNLRFLFVLLNFLLNRRVQLHEVPSDILKLHKLQILDLSQNSLRSIPEVIKLIIWPSVWLELVTFQAITSLLGSFWGGLFSAAGEVGNLLFSLFAQLLS